VGGQPAHTPQSAAYDGHAAITRPVTVGSVTATLAARLATLPTTSNAHGSTPPRLPEREVGQQRSRRGDGHPVNRERRQRLHPARLPVQLHQQMHTQVRDCCSDQRQQRPRTRSLSTGSTDPPPGS
jgi:hypothetical protein